MSRFLRKKRPEYVLNIHGIGIFDLVDNEIKQTFYITDAEYDYLTEKMIDAEIDNLLIDRQSSFGKKRKCLEMINKYLKEMK